MIVAFDMKKYDAEEAFRRARGRYKDEYPKMKRFSLRLLQVSFRKEPQEKGGYFSWKFEGTP